MKVSTIPIQHEFGFIMPGGLKVLWCFLLLTFLEIFLNTNIGIEITANYDFFKNNNMNKKAKGYSLNIGLKIHLEKKYN